MARSKWISFKAQEQLERAAKAAATTAPPALPQSSADAKKFGLENFGNICYANSVLQALYFCTPFRDLLLQDVDSASQLPAQESSPVIPPTLSKPAPPLVPVRRKPERKPSTSAVAPSQNAGHPIPASPPTLYSALQSLFLHISTNPGDKGTVSPRVFIEKLKELNEHFRPTTHQDAHEFLNYLLNQVVEEIETERRQTQNGVNGEDLSSSIATLGSKTPPTVLTATTSSNSGTHPQDATLVHKLFEGVLTSETRCLTCETVSSRDESFLDLSIDIEQNSSVTACLRQFSASEMLCQKNKFFCDSCYDLQEAEKRMKIKKLPNVLALHLKRFKIQEEDGRYIKLAYRVAFPFELRLFNTVDDLDDADRLYNLFAIVVHIGNGPHHGHYISIIKTAGTWLVFDDDNVYPIPEGDIPKYFGDPNSGQRDVNGSAYVLYYQAVDIDHAALGLRLPPPPQATPEALTNSIPPLQRSPALSHQVPNLPPGLNILPPSNGDADHSVLPPPQLPPSNPSSISSPSISPPPPPEVSSPLPPVPPPTSTTPVTPSFGRQIFNTIRRAPSMTASRSVSGSGSDHRKSATEKSPRPSTSTPSFVATIESNEEIPPLPPMPLLPLQTNLPHQPQQHSPVVTTPIAVPQVNEPAKEEKEKTKSSGNWFTKKRKSLKIGDKSRPDSPAAELPPSPFLHGDEFQQSSSKSSTSSNVHALKPLRRPSENGAAEVIGLHPDSRWMNSSSPSGKERNRRSNGFDGTHSQGSRSSSPSSTSLSTHAQGLSTRPAAQPSTSLSSNGSGPKLEFPPPRKASLVPSSADWKRTSVDRKRSLDLKARSTMPAGVTPPLASFNKDADLPPLPPTHKHSQRPSISNGHFFVSEPESILKGKSRSTENDTPSPLQASPLRQASSPPVSLAASIGANTSSGSATSGSSNLKRATRKLSLTAPILGFGKNKDREKERAREREKDRVSPSAFNHRF
ncbi:unnamed protein product [Cyclocybe aegerita]|uniref:Ubiquitin carboxyl-terminal hydrolase n=1 Tax=Cyclocybe aegerita TaxID=1973307 RepID=A0A8S0VZ78_CYCAE|nr:unnamed protein product [Cyclocybe aegerita]